MATTCTITLPTGEKGTFNDIMELYGAEKERWINQLGTDEKAFMDFLVLMDDQLALEDIPIQQYQDMAIRNNWKWRDLDNTGQVTRYVHKTTGQVIALRVTDKQSDRFIRMQGVAQALKQQKARSSEVAAEAGTQGHAEAAWYLSTNAEKYGIKTLRTHERPNLQAGMAAKVGLHKGLDYLLENIQKMQNKIQEGGQATIITEQKLYDPMEDMAGTIDLMVRFSDGSVAIYDFKFVGMLKKGRGDKLEYTEIYGSKRESYDGQMQAYKNMLEKYLGVTKFRSTRVIPIARMQVAPNNQNIAYLEMYTGKESAKEIRPIPLANETLHDDMYKDAEKINSFVSKLRQRLEALNKKKSPSLAIQKQKEELQAAIDDLLIQRQHTELVEAAKELLVYIAESADDMHYEDLNNAIHAGELYLEMLNSQLALREKQLTGESAEDFVTRTTGQGGNIEEARLVGRMQSGIGMLYSKLEEKVAETAEDMGIAAKITDPQRDLNQFNMYFNSISDIENPAIQTFWRLYGEKMAMVKARMDRFERQVDGFSKELSSEQIKSIIDPDTQNIIREVDRNFWNLREKAMVEGDMKWMKENTSFDMTEYKKEEALKRELFNQAYPAKKAKEKLEQWKKKYNLTIDPKTGKINYPTAWENSKNRFMVPKKGMWENPKFQAIKNNKKLLEFYNFYTNTMGELLYGNEDRDGIIKYRDLKDLNKNFLPMVRKEFAESGIQLKGLGERFKDLYTARSTDESIGVINPATGLPEAEIPLMYTSNYKFKELKENKSTDVLRSMYLFKNAAEMYLAKKSIEPEVQAIGLYIKNQKIYQTDSRGRATRDASGRLELVDSDSQSRLFEKIVAREMYGQYIQSKDIVLGKDISLNKVAQSALTTSSGIVLGLQPFIAAVAATSASINRMFMGAEGVYFNNKNYRSMLGRMFKKDEKYWGLSRFWDVNKDEEWRADRISKDSVKRLFTFDRFFDLLRIPDETIRRNTTMTMMMHYGLDPKGKEDKAGYRRIKNLKYLPEGTKSLWETMEHKDDGTVTIEGIDIVSPESPVRLSELNRFREMGKKVAAKATGQASEHDMMLYKTELVGRLMSQYRTWIPMMVQARFGGLGFDQTTEEFEVGRARVLGGELFNKENWAKTTLNLAKEILFLFHRPNTPVNDKITEFYFNKFVDENPDFANVVKRMGREEAMLRFKEMRLAKFHGAMIELRAIAWGFFTTMVLVPMVLAGGEDDPLAKRGATVAGKILRDLAFFYHPASFKELFSNAVPIVSFAARVGVILPEFFKEVAGWAGIGEGGEPLKKAGDLVPVANWINDYYEDLEKQKK